MSAFAYLDVDMAFTRNGATEALDELLDRVLDELLDLGCEADYVSTDASLTATITLPIEGRGNDQVVDALITLRSALHAAGCGTSSWDGMDILAARSRANELVGAA